MKQPSTPTDDVNAPEDDGVLDAQKMERIAGSCAQNITQAEMDALVRLIVDTLNQRYDTKNSCMLAIFGAVQKIDYFKKYRKDAEFVTYLLVVQLDIFYSALRARTSDPEKFSPKVFIDLTGVKAHQDIQARTARKYTKRARPATIMDALPEMYHKRLRTLLKSAPSFPVQKEAINNISREQRKAVAEIVGLLFAASRGDEIRTLIGLNPTYARSLLAEQPLPENSPLQELWALIQERARKHDPRTKYDEETRRLIIAYIRLDAQRGGKPFDTLTRILDISASGLAKWATDYRDMPMNELLSQSIKRQLKARKTK